ncbi:MAG: flagellar basal body P-ring protein FlgI [Melioribacteraceae bacterium]|nr:flagellar basal body P-ring protein FlgI [Melioribacteraceae bacterium]
MKKVLLIIILLIFTSASQAQRIKDISYFKGVQSEMLISYGLVVGLAGSGDSHRSSFTVQSVVSMLKRFGITAPETNLRTRNVAAVMITARVNNLLKPGAEFDVTVSSAGDATSLMGGTLLMTPLSAKDGTVIARCQGPISVGGYDINTASGGRLARNHAATGRIPSGGILEKELEAISLVGSEVSVILKHPDFTTANNVAVAINTAIGDETAIAEGAAEIKITVPQDRQDNFAAFLAAIEAIEVEYDYIAKVVLNERTGTVVAGEKVKIQPVTISHGSLNISIKSFPIISQPNAFAEGETTLFNNLVPTVSEEGANAVSIQGASNVQEVAAALNSLQISPRDIIAIFQALKEAGALSAELVII